MSAAWPTVAARLIDIFRGITDSPVFDGPPVTSAAPPDYVTVGYSDDDVAGSYAVEAIYDGNSSQETGSVVCQIVAQSGGTDLAAVRARVFSIEHGLREAIRLDHTLGVLSPDGVASLETDVLSVQNSKGSAQTLVCTVSYTTRY